MWLEKRAPLISRLSAFWLFKPGQAHTHHHSSEGKCILWACAFCAHWMQVVHTWASSTARLRQALSESSYCHICWNPCLRSAHFYFCFSPGGRDRIEHYVLLRGWLDFLCASPWIFVQHSLVFLFSALCLHEGLCLMKREHRYTLCATLTLRHPTFRPMMPDPWLLFFSPSYQLYSVLRLLTSLVLVSATIVMFLGYLP